MNKASYDTNTEPARLRALARSGVMREKTGSLAPGYQQANIAILPQEWAGQFHDYVEANRAACPLLAVGDVGSPFLPMLGTDIDIRSDLPRYRVMENGAVVADPFDIHDLWRDDLVIFALGCSLGFEAALMDAGVVLRCHTPGNTCSAFVTTIDTVRAGVFSGPLVVSMRAVHRDQVDLAYQITAAHPETHGAPVHVGDPAAIGVDLGQPIAGIGLTDIGPDEVPVFWPCGVSSQYALASAALPFAITHYPGHMLVTDRKTVEGDYKNINTNGR